MRVVYSKDPDGGTRTTTGARKHGRAVQSGRSLVAFASTASCMPLGKVLFVRSAYATSSTSQPAANLHAAVSSAKATSSERQSSEPALPAENTSEMFRQHSHQQSMEGG